MNQVVIFFVPTGASQQDFEDALRQHFKPPQVGESLSQPQPGGSVTITDNDQLPLWTWFVPNWSH